MKACFDHIKDLVFRYRLRLAMERAEEAGSCFLEKEHKRRFYEGLDRAKRKDNDFAAQIYLAETIDSEECYPSHAQAIRMRQRSREGKLNMDDIFQMMREQKGNQKGEKRGRVKKWIAKVKMLLTGNGAEGYVDTAIKLIIAVVIGALLLGGLYYLFNSILLDTWEQNRDKRLTQIGFDSVEHEFFITLYGAFFHRVTLGHDAGGVITRLDNAIEGFEESKQSCEIRLQELYKQIENAKAEIAAPFPQEAELEEKCRRLDELNAELNMDKPENEIVDGAEEMGEDVNEEKRSPLQKLRDIFE